MPSDFTAGANPAEVSGRCYCGRTSIIARAPPQIVTYCHCADCRRWTGAPAAAFAAFADTDIGAKPSLGEPFSSRAGIDRWTCPDCGSPLAARFDYLPGQIYVPLGILDGAEDLPPQMHCHEDSRLPWLHIDDALLRTAGSGRTSLCSDA